MTSLFGESPDQLLLKYQDYQMELTLDLSFWQFVVYALELVSIQCSYQFPVKINFYLNCIFKNLRDVYLVIYYNK